MCLSQNGLRVVFFLRQNQETCRVDTRGTSRESCPAFRGSYPEKQDKTPWMYRVYQPGKFLDFAAGKKQLSDHFDLGTFPHDWYKKTKGIQTPGYYKIILTAEASAVRIIL